jgi:DNA-directed RNA polymerase specialized sigma24 family protein
VAGAVYVSGGERVFDVAVSDRDQPLPQGAGRRYPVESLPEVLIDRGGDPAEALAQGERLDAVARGVLALPAEQRAALVLREQEGAVL